MTQPVKIIRNILIGWAGLLAIVFVAAIVLVQTAWFRNFAREKMIAVAENSTGGRAEIGALDFDWRHLRATVNDFVIHGNEPAGAVPFVRIGRVQADIRLFAGTHGWWDITYLGIDRPAINVIVFPDGTTNIPKPKIPKKPQTPALQTIVDLAVRHFVVDNGEIAYASRKQPVHVRGNNLVAQLWYSPAEQGYRGRFALQPLYVSTGANPVDFTITLPVALFGDKIDFSGTQIASTASAISISGTIENLRNPRINAQMQGQVGLVDIQKLARANLELAPGEPGVLSVTANASVADGAISVSAFRLRFGNSGVEASGLLKDPRGQGALRFRSSFDLTELGRLMNVKSHPEGIAALTGAARLDPDNNFRVEGEIEARRLALTSGPNRIENVDFASGFYADRHRVKWNALRVMAYGGEITGDATLDDFAQYQFQGAMRSFEVRTIAAALGQSRFPYSGIAGGTLSVAGNLKTPGIRGLEAHARISIAPGARGVPVSGRVYADYSGAADDVRVQDSFIALPHTRVNVNGSAKTRLAVALRSTDLDDLLVLSGARPPVALNRGQLEFTGSVAGGLTQPQLSGELNVNRFLVAGRQFDSLSAAAAVSSTSAEMRNAMLTRDGMRALFSASAVLTNWRPLPNNSVLVNGSVRDGDLADAIALAGRDSSGYAGRLAANLHIEGTVGNPRGSANVQIGNGAIAGEPFDRIQAQVNLSDRVIAIPSATLEAGAARASLSAEYRHPRDSLTQGQLHARAQASGVELGALKLLEAKLPRAAGQIRFDADVSCNIRQIMRGGRPRNEFELTSLNADASLRSFSFEGLTYGDLNLTARTNAGTVAYNLTSDFAGSSVRVNGATLLSSGYPTDVRASMTNLPVERALALARRSDIAIRGTLSGTAHFSGTASNPQGEADLTLVRGAVYGEPVDRVQAQVAYLPGAIEVPRFRAIAGPSHLELSGRYEHAPDQLLEGTVQFQISDSQVDLARIRAVQARQPGLGGLIRLAANGAARLRDPARLPSNEPRLLLQRLNADVSAGRLTMQGKPLGGATFTAKTSGTNHLTFGLDSDVAGAALHGRGSAMLSGDYPIDSQLSFTNVSWNRIRNVLNLSAGSNFFEASADGQVTLRGPALRTNQLTGRLSVDRFEVSSTTPPRNGTPVLLRNEGSIALALEGGIVRIESAHLSGPKTDIQASGTAPLALGGAAPKPMQIRVNGSVDLAILQTFSRQIYSSGDLSASADIRGTIAAPLINGELRLQRASFNYEDFPAGISNANGTIQFNGNRAFIRNLTGESGGGKVTLAGFVARENGVRFALRSNAAKVRIRVQQGVSVIADAQVNLSGSMENSLLTGTATVDQINYAPQTDFASILTRTAPPVQAPSAPSPFLDNMKLDVRVRTTSATAIRTSLAENLQIAADLQIRGTARQPGILGRVNITHGKLLFFGNEYDVQTGTVGFFNPVRIEPVLDLALHTTAKGVDVVLHVTGPVDNMKLSYTSDPPLQFQEIVRLLATGGTPTSDPTLLANQPAQAPQSFQQMGESAILSEAVANPLANRLERVFGVSQLKIDPAFIGASEIPQAQVTFQQRITSNINFTYITLVNNPNAETIRVEVVFNPQWSAIAMRDENGIVSVNLLYKLQVR
jgi:translocation and assembly module TamB